MWAVMVLLHQANWVRGARNLPHGLKHRCKGTPHVCDFPHLLRPSCSWCLGLLVIFSQPTCFWFLSFLPSAAQSPPWACNLVTCLSKEREAHLPSRASQNFWSLLVTPWVSENVLSLPQILAVCHWIALSFSLHKKVLDWQVTPCTDRSISLSEMKMNFSEFPVMLISWSRNNTLLPTVLLWETLEKCCKSLLLLTQWKLHEQHVNPNQPSSTLITPHQPWSTLINHCRVAEVEWSEWRRQEGDGRRWRGWELYWR